MIPIDHPAKTGCWI